MGNASHYLRTSVIFIVNCAVLLSNPQKQGESTFSLIALRYISLLLFMVHIQFDVFQSRASLTLKR